MTIKLTIDDRFYTLDIEIFSDDSRLKYTIKECCGSHIQDYPTLAGWYED